MEGKGESGRVGLHKDKGGYQVKDRDGREGG